MSICSKNKNYIIFKEERNMKLRRFMAIGMTVALTATMFSGVQDCGNHEDTRWVAVTDDKGQGLLFGSV